MTDDTPTSQTVPKAVRGEALETEDGLEVPAQQTTGSQSVEGGGEWPHPRTPPREPAPGAAAPATSDESAGDTGAASSPASSPASTSGTPFEAQRFPLNMYETDGALVIIAPLPGVMAGDVEVTIEGRRVSIRAAMRAPADTKNYILHEWHYGPYERTLEVPEGYGGEAAASFGNGQLAVRLTRGDSALGSEVPDTKVPDTRVIVRPSA